MRRNSEMLTSLVSLVCLLAIGFFVMAVTARQPDTLYMVEAGQ